MNKQLIVAMLLCLPSALYAEIYSCTSTGGVLADVDGNAISDLPMVKPITFIVDTEKGIRTDSPFVDRADRGGGYFGTCQNSVWEMDDETTYKAHFCHSNLEVPMVTVTTIYLQTMTSGMGFSAAFLGLGPNLKGKCIEI